MKKILITLFISGLIRPLWGIKPQRDFVASPFEYGYKYSEFDVPVNDSEFVNIWYIPSNSSSEIPNFLILAGGDAGNKSYWIQYINFLHPLFNILLFDYRGFGKSNGSCKSERDYLNDLEKVIEWTKLTFPNGRIYVGGYSLGSGISLVILKERPRICGGILISPILSKEAVDSLCNARGKGPSGDELLPIYDPIKIISSVKSPLLILTGLDPNHPREWAYKLAQKNRNTVVVDFDSLSPFYGIIAFKDTLQNIVRNVLFEGKIEESSILFRSSSSKLGLKYVYLNKAFEAYRAGNMEDYKIFLEKCIYEDSTDLLPYIYLYYFLASQKKQKEALEILEKACEECELRSYPLLFVGTIYMENNKWREAENVLLKSLMLNNWNSEIYVKLAQVYLNLNLFEEANFYLKQAEKVNPYNSQISQLKEQLIKHVESEN